MTPPDQGPRAPLSFLHSSPVHIGTFERLRDRYAPGLEIAHRVREDLLIAAQKAGGMTPALRLHTEEALYRAASARGSEVVVCTCSTLAPVAEELSMEGVTFQRIDRAMADEAVQMGSKIAVVACLEPALAPALDLVRSSATRAGREVKISGHVFFDLWPLFQEGALDDYHAAIAARLKEAAYSCDAIILAQASMAGAGAHLEGHGIPVLSSPESGFKAAVAALTRPA